MLLMSAKGFVEPDKKVKLPAYYNPDSYLKSPENGFCFKKSKGLLVKTRFTPKNTGKHPFVKEFPSPLPLVELV